ncbi:hypothetical protein [Luteolibacter sp. LG18]|uniref:hypothetical protein n=1 Tax=Luteolibacter sp. LG18 TaxID=2819286 RepID=UPI002B2A7B45|nr:hypothetical protein llg_45760 [Luteolibacter sp. LG18]
MRHRLHWLLLPAASAGLSSCAIVKAPFTVAGAVVEGTYNVGEKIVTAPIDAYDRRQAKKDAEKEKADKEAEKKKAKQPQQGTSPGNIMDAQPLPQQTPLPPIAPPQ